MAVVDDFDRRADRIDRVRHLREFKDMPGGRKIASEAYCNLELEARSAVCR